MFNAQELIGTLMQGTLAGSSPRRVEHALGTQGLGQPGGLLSQLLGGGAQGGGASMGTGSGLEGLLGLAQGLLGGMSPTSAPQSSHPPASGGLAGLAGALLGGGQGPRPQSGNPPASGGLAGLAGALLGGNRGAMGGSGGGGVMALLSSLALDALSNMGGGAGSAPAPAPSPSALPLGLRSPANVSEEQELESQALLILKAMLNAAKADGEIDDSELQRIVGKLQAAGADPEAQAFVQQEIRRPLDLVGLVQSVSSSQQAAEIYTASLLAIEVDTLAEQEYLRRLAQGLGLQERVIQRLHAALGIA